MPTEATAHLGGSLIVLPINASCSVGSAHPTGFYSWAVPTLRARSAGVHPTANGRFSIAKRIGRLYNREPNDYGQRCDVGPDHACETGLF